ncbi:ead/Ea22-like family protein [Atlantibacter hermannii]|uniref:ead/Ea22-like family protein n=1 Tax=Atlantibacter hermannii TaxID=565 RepID=UPI0028B07166|nr:ead/Ea22-like family protein [Atlantibacter hermannii]
MTMTAEQLAQLRQKARSASAGDWIKESGDGWEAVSSSDDQANGGFIIAHFEGPDAKANREFMQAVGPQVVEALLDELERKDKRIAKLEARTVTVKLPPLYVGVVQCGHAVMVPYAAGHWFNKTAILEMLADAGINLTVEG